MNTINSNKSNISFGIAFKTYKAPSGNITNEMLTIREELALYKRLNRKLKHDKFIKTELGLRTKRTSLETNNYVPGSLSMRYETNKESYFMDDNKINLHGVRDAFYRVRANFDKILNGGN